MTLSVNPDKIYSSLAIRSGFKLFAKMNKHSELKIVNIFLPIIFNIYFKCSTELSHCGSSFEYPLFMFLLRKRIIIFNYVVYTYLEPCQY